MRVGVKALKNSLSRYRRMVKAGEVNYVAERSAVVAELRAPRAPQGDDELALTALEEMGVVSRGQGAIEDFEPIRAKRGPRLTDVVLETRR